MHVTIGNIQLRITGRRYNVCVSLSFKYDDKILTLPIEHRYSVEITEHFIHNRKLINSNSQIIFYGSFLKFRLIIMCVCSLLNEFDTFHCGSSAQLKTQTMNPTGCFHFHCQKILAREKRDKQC